MGRTKAPGFSPRLELRPYEKGLRGGGEGIGKFDPPNDAFSALPFVFQPFAHIPFYHQNEGIIFAHIRGRARLPLLFFNFSFLLFRLDVDVRNVAHDGGNEQTNKTKTFLFTYSGWAGEVIIQISKKNSAGKMTVER